MVDGQVGALDEADAEQALGAIEGRRHHALEREVRLDLGVVDRELALARTLGPVAPVPGLDLMCDTGRAHLGQQHGALALQRRQRPRPHLIKQPHHRRPGACHRDVQREVGIGREAEQLCLLGTQLEDLADHRAVVGLALVFAAAGPRAPGGLAQVASLAEGQEGHDQRTRQRDHRAAGHAALDGGLARGVADKVGQAGHVGLVRQHELESRFVGKHVLAEARGQRGHAFVDRRESFARLARELRTGAHEVAMQLLEQTPLLGGQRQALTLAVQRVHPREEALVQVDRVGVRRQRPRHLALHGLQRRRGLGGAQVVEQQLDACEQTPARVQARHRVVKARRLGLCRDGIEFGAMLAHRHVEGRREVCAADLGERRHRMRRAPGTQQRIGGQQVGAVHARCLTCRT